MKPAKSETVRLYILEEQEIYREIYKTILPTRASVDLLEVASISDIGTLRQAMTELSPDVLMLSTKRLEALAIDELEQIRTTKPGIGIIILLAYYSS